MSLNAPMAYLQKRLESNFFRTFRYWQTLKLVPYMVIIWWNRMKQKKIIDFSTSNQLVLFTFLWMKRCIHNILPLGGPSVRKKSKFEEKIKKSLCHFICLLSICIQVKLAQNITKLLSLRNWPQKKRKTWTRSGRERGRWAEKTDRNIALAFIALGFPSSKVLYQHFCCCTGRIVLCFPYWQNS